MSKKEVPKLVPCVTSSFLWMPKPMRKALAWISVVGFTLSFASPLFVVPLFFPSFWKNYPKIAIGMVCTYTASFIVPLREW